MLSKQHRNPKVLLKNKGVDKKLVKQYDALEKELQKLGVETKPKFRLTPPLSSNHVILYNK